MHAFAHALAAKQHDAKKSGLKKERGEHFVAQQRSSDIADGFHESGPVGAKLKAHGDAADHTQCKRKREHFDPEAIRLDPMHLSCPIMLHLEIHEQPCQAHRDRRKQNVERDVGSKLHPCQRQCFHAVLLYLYVALAAGTCFLRRGSSSF